jgi:hypothetical protein
MDIKDFKAGVYKNSLKNSNEIIEKWEVKKWNPPFVPFLQRGNLKRDFEILLFSVENKLNYMHFLLIP